MRDYLLVGSHLLRSARINGYLNISVKSQIEKCSLAIQGYLQNRGKFLLYFIL